MTKFTVSYDIIFLVKQNASIFYIRNEGSMLYKTDGVICYQRSIFVQVTRRIIEYHVSSL